MSTGSGGPPLVLRALPQHSRPSVICHKQPNNSFRYSGMRAAAAAAQAVWQVPQQRIPYWHREVWPAPARDVRQWAFHLWTAMALLLLPLPLLCNQ